MFLTSIYLQNVNGYTALRAGLAFLPFAFAITAGAQVARHLLGHSSPRTLASTGLAITSDAALFLSIATGNAHYATDLLRASCSPASASAWCSSPSRSQRWQASAGARGMASGFLMTGPEVGAALGVAVLSAVATTADSFTSYEGIVAGVTRGFIAASAIAGLIAVVAVLRMSAAPVIGGAAGMRGH